MQARDEVEGLPREDFLVGGSQDLHLGERTQAGSFVELGLLGRALERERLAVGRDGLRDEVEVAGADLVLVPRGRVAELLELELVLLQPHVRRHLLLGVAAGELEHRRVERVEAGERDEEEAVAPLAERVLEGRDLVVVEVLAPVEGRRAVVGERLAGEAVVDRLRELPRLAEIRRRRLEPDEVGIRRVREPARDGGVDPVADAVEALRRPLPRDEVAVVLVDVAREEGGRERVRPRDQHGRDPAHVGGEPGSVERLDELLRRHEHLPAEVPALLLRAELVLEVDAGGSGLDHRAHELEGIERAAEAGLCVGEDRREPVRPVPTLGVVDLVGAEQGVVEAPDDGRNAVHGIEALVGIGRAGEVRVGGDLPAGEVDGLEPGAHHLDGLAAGEGSERADRLLAGDQLPEALRTEPRERVLFHHGAA